MLDRSRYARRRWGEKVLSGHLWLDGERPSDGPRLRVFNDGRQRQEGVRALRDVRRSAQGQGPPVVASIRFGCERRRNREKGGRGRRHDHHETNGSPGRKHGDHPRSNGCRYWALAIWIACGRDDKRHAWHRLLAGLEYAETRRRR